MRPQLAADDAEQRPKGGERARRDGQAAFDGRPDGDVDGCVWRRKIPLVRERRGWRTLRTEEVRLQIVAAVGDADEDGARGDAAHAQDGRDGNLHARGHVEVPDHEDGEQPESEVAQRVDDRVEVRQVDDDEDAEALALRAGHSRPEVGDGLALEERHEGEDDAGYGRDGHRCPDDADVDRVDGQAQEEEAD